MSKTLIALAVAAALAGAAVAQPTQPSAGQSPTAQAPALNPAEFDRQYAQALEQMRLMQAQMDQMRTTTDPQERQRLLQAHWASMQAAMAAMHGMWGPGGGMMMGCCGMMGGPMMGWGQMHGYYSNLTPEQLQQRRYMMDRYLPMQQMMMDHMMWHQQWLIPTPPQK